MKTDDIRASYLNFFAGKGCRIVASDSLVPGNDPTLLFTGAGMNQFKDQFMGLRVEYSRATSCQKCIRTGDIMNVGVTPSHHTLFEMLGNFSFGDYFKPEAIAWAWEFLTGVMKIPEARLQVSVHQSDDEAYGLWHKNVGLPANRISRLGDHDNFWPADAPKLGPNGPCGPCSEIFYDRGEKYGCGSADCGITCNCRRWVEIWNLVFTQFDRQPDGSLAPLPQRNIDTGMGLERMASCMQGTATNMDIDIFQPLVKTVAEFAGKRYGETREHDVLMRRIADHARAVTFCIGDGVLPANSHRGYVLKRLLRRAVLDGRTLGIGEAFLHRLAPVVGEVMRQPYPEIAARAANISATIEGEEKKFLSTLDKGLARIGEAIHETRGTGRTVLPGATAFELYDTYGFPYELAEEVVAREGLSVDRAGFDQAMTEAKQRAREGAKMKGDVFAKGPVQEVKKLTAKTEFLGYETLTAEGKVLALVAGEALVSSAETGARVTVVLDRTPFYGESGGQVGDTGLLIGPDNLVIEIEDTQKIDDIHFHVGVIESGKVAVGQTLKAEVAADRRTDIRRNHTVTHLLHHALHEVLGDRAEQKGSYVAPDRMRFDFQHGQALTAEEERRIEEIVNLRILENAPVVTQVMAIEEAKKLGATALFGEKYGETVRVISVGDFSREFCGGTHLTQTGPIGSFRIESEQSVAAGVRRIEGVTGAAAYRLGRRQGELLDGLARELKSAPAELPARLTALQDEIKSLRKELSSVKQGQVAAKLAQTEPAEAAGVKYLAVDLGPVLGKELSAAAESAQAKLGPAGVVVLAGAEDGKAGLVISVGKELAPARLKAGDLVKKLAPLIGGGGGGRPELAQAGGKQPEKVGEMLAAVPSALAECLK